MRIFKHLNYKDWLYVLIFLCITIACLYLAELIHHNLTKSILQQIASIIGITGVLSIILRKHTLHETIELISEKTELSKKILESGICYISPDHASVDFKKEIVNSKNEIDVCLIYGSTWLKFVLDELQKFLKKNKSSRLRICMLDPCSISVKALSIKFKEGNLEDKIKDSVNLVLNNFDSQLFEENRVSLFVHEYIPEYVYYRFDGKIFVIPYKVTPGRCAVPIFGFSNKDENCDVYDFFKNDFEELVTAHSKPINRSQSPVV